MDSKIAVWTGPLRIPFLILTPACVFLGLGTALTLSRELNWLYFGLVMTGAVFAHISVNAFNEYFDFQSGLDSRTQRTPFSGGSGVLPQNPGQARYVFIIAWGSLIFTGAIGVFLTYARGLSLLPLGLAGIVLIVTYTRWITRHPIWCLLAPGLAFGPLMVMGTDFILTGRYSLASGVVSLIPFFLVNGLLLLNQFPDYEADQTVGRRTLPVVLGRSRAAVVYMFFLGATYGILFGFGYGEILPRWCWLGLIPGVAALPLMIGVWRHAEDTEGLLRYMGWNVVLTISTPVLAGTGLLLAR